MLVLISLRLWRLESGKISERRCIKFINFQKFCSKKRLTRLSTATYQLKIFSDSLAEIRFLQVFFGISTLLGFRSFSEISPSSSSSDICSQFLKWSTDTITQTVNTAVVGDLCTILEICWICFLAKLFITILPYDDSKYILLQKKFLCCISFDQPQIGLLSKVFLIATNPTCFHWRKNDAE